MPESQLCVRTTEGRSICFESYDQNPGGTDYVRVLDEYGDELGYWSQDEWRDEPMFVMGAILGALSGGYGREVQEIQE